MYKSIRVQWLFAVTAGLLALCPPAFAEQAAPSWAGGAAAGPAQRQQNLSPEERQAEREKMREQWQNLSPEQRDAKREEVRQRIENLPPEQREAMKQRLREKAESMPPEEREAVKKKLRARRNNKPAQNCPLQPQRP